MRNSLLDPSKGQSEEHIVLLQKLYSQMFAVAYSKVGNKADALDVVQESWVKILQKIDDLRDEDKLFQWAKAIASNTAINLLRKKNVYEKLLQVEEASVSYGSVSQDLEEKALQETIRSCIQQLEEATRRIMIYKYFHGMKDREISELLQLPIGTVKAKISRGKDRLRRMLKDMYSYHSEDIVN